MGRLVFVNSGRLNENKYTLGSGVGSVSGSNRLALKRRAANSYCAGTSSTKTRYIKVFFPTLPNGIIQISQIAVYSNGINIAPNGTTSAGATLGDAISKNIPINGDLSVRTFPEIYHSSETMPDRYWLLDLGAEFVVDRIVYYNRVVGYAERAIGMAIDTYNANYNNSLPNAIPPLKRFTLTDGLIQTFDL
jgi:hypothetical protein